MTEITLKVSKAVISLVYGMCDLSMPLEGQGYMWTKVVVGELIVLINNK